MANATKASFEKYLDAISVQMQVVADAEQQLKGRNWKKTLAKPRPPHILLSALVGLSPPAFGGLNSATMRHGLRNQLCRELLFLLPVVTTS